MYMVMGMLLMGIGAMLIVVAFHGQGIVGFSGIYQELLNGIRGSAQ